ncbi:uncharacterized protein LOC121728233 [Aricia agestis]|uniref:uncharacterized protein LOC121728233 n=1 Tax=Aricia agestis TaxID=91739 RepID=UPI001C207C59|nr:uncharacterized protein LOC121728233 [Aricia agestis]
MEDGLVELKPHTLEKLRREVDLDDPDRRREAIDILREWIKKQDHFLVKDFSDYYLEWRLLTNGGSIEKSKIVIDRLCTLRTLNPHLFGVYNVKEDFAHVFDNGICFALPKVMEEDIRVSFIKFFKKDHIKTYFVDFLRYIVVMAEYMTYHDYLHKTVLVFDFLDVNLNSFVTDMDFMELKRHSTVLLEGFRMKPQKILLMTESNLAATLLTILKTLLKPKIIQRIQVIRNHEELSEIVPREILPKDYGGDEIAFKDLKEKWLNELSSPKMMEMLKQRSKERTDESLRPMCQFSEHYAGMEGTFRFLRVD